VASIIPALASTLPRSTLFAAALRGCRHVAKALAGSPLCLRLFLALSTRPLRNTSVSPSTGVADFLGRHSDLVTEEGRQRLVRHGHLPEREIMTGIGPVAVRAPRVRNRVGQAESRMRFSSAR
jgi:hypothetical protein